MSSSTAAAWQAPAERLGFARNRFPGPQTAVDIDRLARSARHAPADPRRLLSLPHLKRGRSSADGHVLVMQADQPPRGELYLEPVAAHVIVVNHGIGALTAWTPTSGYYQGRFGNGQSMVVPAGEPVYFKLAGDCACTLMALRPLPARDHRPGTDAAAQLLPPLLGCAVTNDELLLCIAKMLAEEDRGHAPASASLLDMAGVALTAHLDAHYRDDAAPAPSPMDKWLLAVVSDYVQSRIDDTIRLESLAALTGYAKHHFAHLFKATTGLSPMRFVFQVKMERARELVEGTSMSLHEIGSSVGYDDPAQFSRCFSRHWGFTASAWRAGAPRRLAPALRSDTADGIGAGDAP